MNATLYAARNISPRNEDRMRRWLIEHGATIVRERMMPLRTGDFVQFHIQDVDGAYWFASPFVSLDPRNGDGYLWFKSAASNYEPGRLT